MSGALAVEEQPDARAIRQHLEWLTAPARGAYDDALIEIAYDAFAGGPLGKARLFGLYELDRAVSFAIDRNRRGVNVYVGAALRSPDTPQDHRASSEWFYVATAVPIDIDHDYDAVRARMAAIVEDGLVVTTGLTPQRRSQHWVRLLEPCDDEFDYQLAFQALVIHTGADPKVHDAARVMRLGGTISYPSARKRGLGYETELTSVAVIERAKASAIDALKALPTADGALAAGPALAARPGSPPGQVVRGGGAFGQLVVDGRETYFRDLALEHLRRFQEENGADPTPEELFAATFAEFQAWADNADGRWTSEVGLRQLRARCANTIRRLRGGRLASHGLYSIDTETGREDAEAARQARSEAWAARSTSQDAGGPEADFSASSRPAPLVEHVDPATGEVELLDPLDRPYVARDPRTLPLRQFVYGTHFVRRFVSCTFAPGGTGKSFLALAEAAAMASGKALLGVQPSCRLHVWYLSEDPIEEIEKRLEAIRLHYGLAPEDLEGWLRCGSTREADLVMAVNERSGARIIEKEVDRIIDIIRRRSVDVVLADPFVTTHRVSENDNMAIDLVAKRWAKIAGETNTAIDLIHHTSKVAAAGEITVEHGRGASSLLYAARSARVLNTMSEEEARRFGINWRFSHFRVDIGKANLVARPERATWYHFHSVFLGNGGLEGGDSVGVVEAWEVPGSDIDASAEQARQVQERVMVGAYRADARSSEWVGNVVADVLEMDMAEPATRPAVKALIDQWLKDGVLRVEMRHDARRKLKPFIEAGTAVLQSDN